MTPEVASGGPLGKVRDDDVIRLDSVQGTLEALVPEENWSRRPVATADLTANAFGVGRELFRAFRASAAPAEEGGGICG
jgi:phosphogluconate dehydratase